MKVALVTLVTLILLGCSQQSSQGVPTAPGPVQTAAPVPTPSAFASFWGMVVDETGVCIVGATLEVVRGQGAGLSFTQTAPCDVWSYDGGVVLMDLTPGVEMTFRAYAAGYAAQEKTIVPSGTQAVLFTPSRIN